MTSIGCALLLCLRTATAFPTRPIGPTFERDEVDMSSARQWVAIESSSCVSFNSIDPFPSSAAYVPGHLTIVQAAAPSEPLPLREISIRASLLFAPLQWVDLRGAACVYAFTERCQVHKWDHIHRHGCWTKYDLEFCANQSLCCVSGGLAEYQY
eukprot:m.25284 g.25284  ORF g.25284 m.25284 type:complete len:154 (+) comp6182_c0_seq1:132-593(+)